MKAPPRESPRPAAVLRIGLGVVLFAAAACRWPFAIELYSSAGPPTPLFPGTAWEPPVPSPAAAVAMQSLLVFALAAVAAGWRTRLSLCAAVVLSAWLGLLDLPGTFKKYSAIALHMLVLLGLTRCGAAWSVDALVRRDEPDARDSPVWPRTLMRVFLASVYLGAAITKLRIPEFATGEWLEFALLDDLWGGRSLGLRLAEHPRLLGLASLAVLLFELWFPVLVWVPALRRPMLAAAAAFHAALQATMHLGSFSWIMLASLTAFLTDDDLRSIAAAFSRIARRRLETNGADSLTPSRDAEPPVGSVVNPAQGRGTSRRGVLSLAAYVIAAAAAVGGGVAVQRSTDRYGVFATYSPRPLEEIPADDWARMRTVQGPPPSHYVHRLEIGSRLDRDRVGGESSFFRRGMLVHALARFRRHRPPMRLCWLLVAPDGREVARREHPLGAASHASVAFELTDDAPIGRYRIVLQLDGYDAAERAFELVAP